MKKLLALLTGAVLAFAAPAYAKDEPAPAAATVSESSAPAVATSALPVTGAERAGHLRPAAWKRLRYPCAPTPPTELHVGEA